MAVVKYNFTPQTPLELRLCKGDAVNVTRRVDSNWYEGNTPHGHGIFPTSYVEIIEGGKCLCY